VQLHNDHSSAKTKNYKIEVLKMLQP